MRVTILCSQCACPITRSAAADPDDDNCDSCCRIDVQTARQHRKDSVIERNRLLRSIRLAITTAARI